MWCGTMPKAGYRKRAVQPGSHEEREILLKRVGLTREKKAILLAAALDAVAAGLGLGRITDLAPGDAVPPPLEARLRAAGMAFGVLGTKPSRNPMATPAAPAQPAADGEPAWMTDAPGAAPAQPAPPSTDPGDAWGEEAGEAGF